MNIEALIEAFTDPRVVQAIVAAITPAIKQCLQEQLTEMRATITAVQNEQVKQNTVVAELKAENLLLKRRMDVLDAESRLSSLIIRGIPECSYAELASGEGRGDRTATATNISATPTGQIRYTAATEDAVLTLCNKDLSLDLKSGDIVSTYRMKSNDSRVPRSIHVTFSTRKVRDSVYAQRRSLKTKTDMKVYISEDLTKQASELFYEARKLVRAKRLNSAWTAGGNVFVKRLQLDKPTLVRDVMMLSSVC